MIEIDEPRRKSYLRTCRVLSVLCVVAAAFYLQWLLFQAKPDNLALFYLLVGAEVFNITQAAGFWYTISVQKWTEPPVPDFSRTCETIDAFVTVCGEPAEVIEETVRAVAAMRHPRLTVWVLDDDFYSDDASHIAWRHRARYVSRSNRTGAKAGNINNALRMTKGDYVVIFDADHAPRPDFLEQTMGGFEDSKVAFVQTPQVYRNRAGNRVAAGAHEQQGLFYGPILRGKNGCGAVFSCGTNVVFRRTALEAIGGLAEDSITEDLRMSLMLLARGYTSLYVPKVLAHGLGPVDTAGYFSQQMRWARGGLDIFFWKKPFSLDMSGGQMIQYFLSFIYWFTGCAYAIYLILPIAFLATGQRPVVAPNAYPLYFFPYVSITLLTLAYAADFKVTFRAIWFTLASFPIHIGALFSALSTKAATFVVTPKGSSTRSLRPVFFQLTMMFLLLYSMLFGLRRFGLNASVLNNVAFALGHMVIIQGFLRIAVHPLPPGARGAPAAGGADQAIPEASAAAAPVAAITDTFGSSWGK